MKTVLALIIISLFTVYGCGQNNRAITGKPDPTKKIRVVEASCGECQLGLPGKGCDLAVRIDGKAYFVDGTSIDPHGDGHAEDGFCEAIRKAEVQGAVVNDRFKATYFKLIDQEQRKN